MVTLNMPYRILYPLIIWYTLITYNFSVFTNFMISQPHWAFHPIKPYFCLQYCPWQRFSIVRWTFYIV